MTDNLNKPYSERMMVVRLLAITCGFQYGVGKDDNENWDDEWRNVVYIDLPQGQVSWHIAPHDMHLFEDFPKYEGKWDGNFNGNDVDFIKSMKPCTPFIVNMDDLKTQKIIETMKNSPPGGIIEVDQIPTGLFPVLPKVDVDWKPLASAPKDGRVVEMLEINDKVNCLYTAWWCGDDDAHCWILNDDEEQLVEEDSDHGKWFWRDHLPAIKEEDIKK